MYLLHVYAMPPTSCYDLDLLGRSTIKNKSVRSAAKNTKFKLNGRDTEGAYFLANGIYPRRSNFMKIIPHLVSG